MSIDITYQCGGEDRMRRGNGPFMFTEYDVIRAFDAGSVFFSKPRFGAASKGEILSFSYFRCSTVSFQYLQKMITAA